MKETITPLAEEAAAIMNRNIYPRRQAKILLEGCYTLGALQSILGTARQRLLKTSPMIFRRSTGATSE